METRKQQAIGLPNALFLAWRPQPLPGGTVPREGSRSQPCQGSRTSLLHRELPAELRMPIHLCHSSASSLPMTTPQSSRIKSKASSRSRPCPPAGPASYLLLRSLQPLGPSSPALGCAPGHLHSLFCRHSFCTDPSLFSFPALGSRDTSSEPPSLTTFSKAVLPATPLSWGFVISGAVITP